MDFYDAKVSSLFTNKTISLSQLFMTKNSREDSLTPTRGLEIFCIVTNLWTHSICCLNSFSPVEVNPCKAKG